MSGGRGKGASREAGCHDLREEPRPADPIISEDRSLPPHPDRTAVKSGCPLTRSETAEFKVAFRATPSITSGVTISSPRKAPAIRASEARR